jgi:hypothetical protein
VGVDDKAKRRSIFPFLALLFSFYLQAIESEGTDNHSLSLAAPSRSHRRQPEFMPSEKKIGDEEMTS